MITPELRLFGYYTLLFKKDFRDILTENDVQAIIDELKQFQPTELAKLLHHTDDILKYTNNVKREVRDVKTEPQGGLKEYYLTYTADDGYEPYRLSFSPTIDKALLRAITEHPEVIKVQPVIFDYSQQYKTSPLFTNLAHTTNNNIIPLIQFFLDSGVDINFKNPNFNNTIFTIVGTLEIAQFLLANGGDPTIKASNGSTPLMYAISNEGTNELIKFLIDIGVDLNASTAYFDDMLGLSKDKVERLQTYQASLKEDGEQADEIATALIRIEKAETVVKIIAEAMDK